MTLQNYLSGADLVSMYVHSAWLNLFVILGIPSVLATSRQWFWTWDLSSSVCGRGNYFSIYLFTFIVKVSFIQLFIIMVYYNLCVYLLFLGCAWRTFNIGFCGVFATWWLWTSRSNYSLSRLVSFNFKSSTVFQCSQTSTRLAPWISRWSISCCR